MTTKAATKWTRITLDDVATAVSAAVAFELGLSVRSPGTGAIIDWFEEADALGSERLSAALDILGWETAAHFESLFGWRRE